jgi:hypothetical protein
MHTTRLISGPNTFLVETYVPGLTIDFRVPCVSTDLDRFRAGFSFAAFEQVTSEAEFIAMAGRTLVSLGIAESEADFGNSMYAFTGASSLDEQLYISLRRLGCNLEFENRAAALAALFAATGCLHKADHHPVRLYCHAPGERTQLEADATHYAYVLDGECRVKESEREVGTPANTFFSIAGEAVIEGSGRFVVVTHFGFRGMTQYGGSVEPWGRLNYIDGCTDTLLVPPPRKGDPCYNALYFPAGTAQTQHLHPSLRCGLVIQGSGVCKTPFGDHALEKGRIFFLPPETYHSFHTGAQVDTSEPSALTVIAFHPDSDFGPTDTDHPMVNRTYFQFMHRMVSKQRESGAEFATA